MATQYPLQSKAFIWLLSVLCLLSRTLYSALHIRARVPATSFSNIVGDDKTIMSHDKTSTHLPCSQISMRITEYAFKCFNRAKSILFHLNLHYSNAHATAANDKVNFVAGEREDALGYNERGLAA